jgi:hypothetical protein
MIRYLELLSIDGQGWPMIFARQSKTGMAVFQSRCVGQKENNEPNVNEPLLYRGNTLQDGQ